MIERYQAEGWAVHREPVDLLATCWAFVHGFVVLWTGGPLAAPYDGQDMGDVLHDLFTPVLDGLGSAPPAG